MELMANGSLHSIIHNDVLPLDKRFERPGPFRQSDEIVLVLARHGRPLPAITLDL